MINFESDQGAFIDVDETLVLVDNIHDHTITGVKQLHIIENPLTGIKLTVIPHFAIIQKMKEHHGRGHKVFVWSQGGYKWAEAVVKSLGLEQYVTAILPKGPWYWDDKKADDFLDRCYIAPPTSMKEQNE